MANMYEQIAKKMGTPWSNEMEKILTTLYTPEEAEILLVFNGPYLDRFTAQKIAKKVKQPNDKIEPILKEMSRTQRLFSAKKDGETFYSMFPLIPGLFELYFSNYKRASEEEEDVLKLFTEEYEKYYNKGYVVNSLSSSYPFMRVFVEQELIDETISGRESKILEINEEVEVIKNRILPFEEVRNLVEKSRRISVMDCACRTHMKIYNKGIPVNDYPINVCMNFNTFADYCIEQGFGRELTKEGALKTLAAAAKAGLVHTTQNVTEKISFICNCDRDCCIMLRGIRQFNNPNMVANSNFQPEYEKENCIFCLKCTEICPMQVIKLIDEDSEDQRISINIDRCIGCGVCAFNCPEGALSMIKKFDKIPVENMIDALTKTINGRIK
ncbi:MAG: 4Fe-4S dicluster domain-containing protein [Candidatus Lokiarchaeota archaeon]|nr:4Fe-4S dicluster domain-containing protein [Candidatus Lokiarchaeota archaeon]